MWVMGGIWLLPIQTQQKCCCPWLQKEKIHTQWKMSLERWSTKGKNIIRLTFTHTNSLIMIHMVCWMHVHSVVRWGSVRKIWNCPWQSFNKLPELKSQRLRATHVRNAARCCCTLFTTSISHSFQVSHHPHPTHPSWFYSHTVYSAFTFFFILLLFWHYVFPVRFSHLCTVYALLFLFIQLSQSFIIHILGAKHLKFHFLERKWLVYIFMVFKELFLFNPLKWVDSICVKHQNPHVA